MKTSQSENGCSFIRIRCHTDEDQDRRIERQMLSQRLQQLSLQIVCRFQGLRGSTARTEACVIHVLIVSTNNRETNPVRDVILPGHDLRLQEDLKHLSLLLTQ